ncbi:OST-HTH/LOTUS domain-containing protein [Flexithrix dorotheae]|uniref:OST-HTH/LOTUS domain-containing protein n=1 Tax=Flexithrix dorotheae TaxID=70993 RepID=UPI0012FB8522|nr:OST-HTH/LOTUS domain-containing protein [Flexithrix dorotheae]
MENLEIEKVIKNALAESCDETGWANLAKVGTELRKNGVKYGKLSRFFNNYQDLVEVKTDYSINPPVVYAKLREHQEELAS